MEDTFRFVMPAELTKGQDGDWKISGLASTSAIDRQGEVIDPIGIDASPIAQGRGFFNFDHDNSPESTIGLLDGYKKTDRGMYVSGRLFKNHTKAKAVYEIMSSLGKGDAGRIGMSVEGKVLERDAFNKSIIKRCVVKNIAITMNPVNTETYADIIKSFNGSQVEFDSSGKPNHSLSVDGLQIPQTIVKSEEVATFTASQVLQIVEKALGIGAGNAAAPEGRTGGDALSVSDMGEKPKKKKKDEVEKGGEGSGKVGHETHHFQPATLPGHTFSHSEHHTNGDVTHHFLADSKGHQSNYDDAVHNKLEAHSEKHYGGAHKMNGTATGWNQEKKRHTFEARLRKSEDIISGKKTLKKMSKEMYKSEMDKMMDQLQKLYPENSRQEIWSAVKDRMNTTFEELDPEYVNKGGPGSGRKESKIAEGLADAHGQMVATINQIASKRHKKPDVSGREDGSNARISEDKVKMRPQTNANSGKYAHPKYDKK